MHKKDRKSMKEKRKEKLTSTHTITKTISIKEDAIVQPSARTVKHTIH